MQATFAIHIGALTITQTVVTTWAIMALLAGATWYATRRPTLVAGNLQVVTEGIVEVMRSTIAAVLPDAADSVLPFIGTLWIFLVFANLAGVVPGISSPTADLSTTAGLAVMVFFFVHWAGVRAVGWKAYLRHYVSPNPIILPFEIITEISRTVTLAVRLFGNMMSLELAALIVLGIAGFLVPVPLLLLHVVEALIQAYIFGMLALLYIAGSVAAQQERLLKGVRT